MRLLINCVKVQFLGLWRFVFVKVSGKNDRESEVMCDLCVSWEISDSGCALGISALDSVLSILQWLQWHSFAVSFSCHCFLLQSPKLNVFSC